MTTFNNPIIAILEQADKLSIAEKITLNKGLVKLIKYERNKQNMNELMQFGVGDKVKFIREDSNRLPMGSVGTIKKVNRVNIVVDFDHKMWNVSPCFLKKV